MRVPTSSGLSGHGLSVTGGSCVVVPGTRDDRRPGPGQRPPMLQARGDAPDRPVHWLLAWRRRAAARRRALGRSAAVAALVVATATVVVATAAVVRRPRSEEHT